MANGKVDQPLNLVPESVESANGTNGSSTKASRFDPNFTDSVVNATGPKANPRLKQVMGSLVRHLHDFCRENEITMEEYMMGIKMVRVLLHGLRPKCLYSGQINECGQMSTDRRDETQLMSDILGIESLVDEITYKLVDEAKDAPTATAVLGPFWRKNAPIRKMGDTIVMNELKDADHVSLHGRVLDFHTGKPIENAEIDLWHTAPNGLYEQQDPDQPDMVGSRAKTSYCKRSR